MVHIFLWLEETAAASPPLTVSEITLVRVTGMFKIYVIKCWRLDKRVDMVNCILMWGSTCSLIKIF